MEPETRNRRSKAKWEMLVFRSTLSTAHQPAPCLSSTLYFQDEADAANKLAKMTQLANQNAEYNPNRSVAMGVDQLTIVDSGSEGEWSD